ncbi:MAG: AsnC family transcriptional regulator [Candidatus Thorarchaeota archaeon]|nr:AsnC family transcriptional regulator [Candidatus Thorarchaeota archaeon]
MDIIDKGILSDLTDNCRITYEELSRKHGISANAIRKRITRLEETKVISAYTVSLSTAMIGSEFVFAILSTDGSRDEVEFVNEIGSNPWIIAASSYTDGSYLLIGEYTSTDELMAIATHLRSLDSVHHVELHTILQSKGGIAPLGNLHLRVLRCLLEDARMPIIDIANKTGLTARRVLEEIEASNSVHTSILLELGAASSIPFVIWFTYDQKKIGPRELEAWLEENYDLPLWQVFLSVAEPVAGGLFAVDTLTELDEIVRSIRKNDFIMTAKVSISTHHDYFEGPRSRKLREMIEAASGKKVQ